MLQQGKASYKNALRLIESVLEPPQTADRLTRELYRQMIIELVPQILPALQQIGRNQARRAVERVLLDPSLTVREKARELRLPQTTAHRRMKGLERARRQN